MSLREKGEWQRVKEKRQKETNRKQNKTGCSYSGILTSNDRDTHSRVTISLDLILRDRRFLGNYGPGTEVGETELSQELHYRILLLGPLGHCNLNLLSRWTGLLHQVLTLEGLFLLLCYSGFQCVVHVGEVPDAKTIFIIITTILCQHLH